MSMHIYDKDGKPNPKFAYRFDREGFDKNGYDIEGFDKNGFDKKGKHKVTKTEFDQNGYNRYGINDKGYDAKGYHESAYHFFGLDERYARKVNIEDLLPDNRKWDDNPRRFVNYRESPPVNKAGLKITNVNWMDVPFNWWLIGSVLLAAPVIWLFIYTVFPESFLADFWYQGSWDGVYADSATSRNIFISVFLIGIFQFKVSDFLKTKFQKENIAISLFLCWVAWTYHYLDLRILQSGLAWWLYIPICMCGLALRNLIYSRNGLYLLGPEGLLYLIGYIFCSWIFIGGYIK